VTVATVETKETDERHGRVVQVVPLLRLQHLGDRSFDYSVPPELDARVTVGSVVEAPFGRRMARAIVIGVGPSQEDGPAALKAIETVLDDSVPPELLELARALSERYLSSFESCLRLVAPPTSGRRPGSAPARVRCNWVVPVNDAAPVAPADGMRAVKLTAKQSHVVECLPEEGLALSELCVLAGVGPAVVKALAAKGVVELTRPPEDAAGAEHAASAVEAPSDVRPALWPEQESAVAGLVEAYEEPGLAERLLWGVTGSGKTEVYLRLVERALADGVGTILLVPEIALTPQMIARVRARFGARVGVLHSGLATGERVREHRRIALGEALVVVGARSAVFAPVPHLRLIIVDEAHDGSYKQEESPRYHARTVAAMRLAKTGGLLLEGSATPSAESLGRPTEGRVRLLRRAAGQMPACEVVDMRRQGGGQLLAPICQDALAQTLRAGEQAILLLNRRGYAGHVHCDLCGHVMSCADCELSLTYHSRERRLVCHHCGRGYAQPALCPECGQAPLTRGNPGTERLDRELRTLVPNDKVFRLDSDVLTSGTRVHALLDEFSTARPAVLVGTQMVAKGHDFGDVTLVVVADADTGLYMPDFRAAEKTFQLLTQVAGRAGRAGKPGRVLVQTWNPDVPCIRMALERDEQGFYSEELRNRRRLGYPPFVDLIRMVTVADDGDRAQVGAQYLVERLSRHFATRELRGPVRLPILRGRSRWHLLIAASDGERARAIVAQAMAQLWEPYRQRGVAILVDVDPQSFG
jgi:primosomal protein N' (replication factor Y) (superfamily II helicase)